MLGVNRINGAESLYTNKNNKISFKSKFFPNEALKDAFYVAKYNTKSAVDDWYDCSRQFARIIDYLLNDGKDDLIKLTTGPKGSATMTINNKRVNFYRANNSSLDKLDLGKRTIENFIDYYTENEIVGNTKIAEALYTTKLTKDEFKSVKSAIDTLNSDLNADDAIRNPKIYYNLLKNMDKVNSTIRNNTFELLENLESKIFKK